MKKIAGLLAIMLTIGGSAFANGVKGKNKPSTDASVNVSISIYDTTGETVFTEVQTSALITRNYNLNSLPNGVYTVTVTSDHYTVSRSLDIR